MVSVMSQLFSAKLFERIRAFCNIECSVDRMAWPTRKETTNNSIVVVVTCLFFGLWIAFADVAFQWAQDLLYGLSQ